MHPIDFLYRHATHILTPHMELRTATSDDHCTICHRDQEDWYEPDVAADWKVYKNQETHCSACHSLFVGAVDKLGVERIAGKKIVPVKLGMLTGCGMLVTPDKTTLYLNSFIKKMDVPKKPWPLVELTGTRLITHIISELPANDQYLFINNFGRQKDKLVSHLSLSNKDTLYICGVDSQEVVNIPSYERIRRVFLQLPKKAEKNWKGLMRLLIYGHITPLNEKLVDLWTTYPELRDATNAMPTDPFHRLTIIKTLGI